MIQLVPVAIAFLGLAACAKVVSDMKSGSTLTSLAGSEWGPGTGSEQFVQFSSKGELSGFGGCNNFFGTYEQNGEQLTIGPLASTKKACFGDGLMQSETEFLNQLQNTHHVQATHKELRLLNRHGEEITILRRRDWD